MTIGTLMHGWSGLGFAFASVQIPMFAGMMRDRAPPARIIAAPLFAAPTTLAINLGMSLMSSLVPVLSHAPSAQLAIGAMFSVGAGYFAGRALAKETPDVSYRRGSRIADPAPGGQHTERPATLSLGSEFIPPADETKHFKIIGTTGTGKSTAIGDLLRSALKRGDRAVVADPDGGYTRRFYDPGRGDLILNPFDSRSRKWDLFGEIQAPYDVEELARSMIPDHGESDRSWREYARTFFGAVTRQAHEAGVTDVAELYRLLVSAEADELRTLVRGTPAQSFLNEHNARMFDSIRSVTASAVGAIEHIAAQTGPPLSIRDWVKADGTGTLFLPYRAGQISALRSTISSWMRLAIFETMNRPEGPFGAEDARPKPIWFVVDELDALGPIDGLKDALARLRKFEGRCVLGFQSIAQVSSTYGHGDAHTVVENCANTVILRCSASEGGGTARFASQLIGEREVLRTSRSVSRRPGEVFGSTTMSEQIALETALLPSEIEQMPDLVGYFKRASDTTWRRLALQPTPVGSDVKLARHCLRAVQSGRDRAMDGDGRGRE